MNLIFSPNHVLLCNACYPASSALASAGPDYSPNSQELSRLTYYASNHPSKLHKLGSELERRVKIHCRKAPNGNVRARSSLLITLNIFRALATECKRDLSLLSPTLISSLQLTLSSLPADLEVTAKAAGVFTAWTTYTNGQLIGADSNMTANYQSILKVFASLSALETKNNVRDEETANRTRLLGFTVLASALNSEALYNDTAQYRMQITTAIKPILLTILHTSIPLLETQSASVKEQPMQSYLSQFRSRPAIERRAASIHLHVDGEKGPSVSDVANASLQALYSLLQHANGAHLGYVTQAGLDCLDSLNGWEQAEACCWFTNKLVDWSQYQYRYAVPTRLVEQLLSIQDITTTKPQHLTLAAMIARVFSSPTPLVNVSTSDVASNLSSLLLRRVTVDPHSALPHALVECIASLGGHVYYSDQIQDLATQLISCINGMESQPSSTSGARSDAIVLQLKALVGLMQAAQRGANAPVETSSKAADGHIQTDQPTVRHADRSRVSPDTWLDTLSLLFDGDQHVRSNYVTALLYYLSKEIPNAQDVKSLVDRPSSPTGQNGNDAVNSSNVREGDSSRKLLNNIHGRIFILISSGISATGPAAEDSQSADGNSETLDVPPGVPQLSILPATPTEDSPAGSTVFPDPAVARPARSRKVSTHGHHRPAEHRSRPVPSASPTPTDFSHIIAVLVTIFEQLPMSGLTTGVPMLSNLHQLAERASEPMKSALNEILVHSWLAIGKSWECIQLTQMAERALSSSSSQLPSIPHESGIFPTKPSELSPPDFPEHVEPFAGVDHDQVMIALSANTRIQRALGLDKHGVARMFSRSWTAESALNDATYAVLNVDNSSDDVSPLLKITPALMYIENLSLQSLARSSRGVGVNDLREALEGRGSMSNPALAKAPSIISTLDRASSIVGSDVIGPRSSPAASRSRSKRSNHMGTGGEVRDVLNKLGIGKQQQQGSNNLLKASFPAVQKTASS